MSACLPGEGGRHIAGAGREEAATPGPRAAKLNLLHREQSAPASPPGTQSLCGPEGAAHLA